MLEFINDNIISVLTPILLLVSGLYFSFKLNWFYVRHPIKMIRSMLSKPKNGGISPFRAVTLALAGTLGVGNIAGVASSIAIGGFGSVFWMWVSAAVAMVLKYAEIVLAIRHRRREGDEYRGGASYYILDFFASKGKGAFGKVLGGVFALLCIVNAVTMGCVIQSNAISTSFEGVTGVPTWIIGAILAILCAIVISGNAKWVSAFSEKTVPIMTVGYVLLSVAVIAARWELLDDAIAAIFKDAFAFDSAAGGIIGFAISRGMRAGCMRGLMSNEAGCGTAPTAHASADTNFPAAQGVWGIFEVFVDTVVLCTMTALVILVAIPDLHDFGLSPAMMTVRAYSSALGTWAEYFFAAAVFCFGYATLICWAGYGLESVRAISIKKRYKRLYLFAFFLCVPLGALVAPDAVWDLSDFAIASLTAINLAVLLLMRKSVRDETQRFFHPRQAKNSGRGRKS